MSALVRISPRPAAVYEVSLFRFPQHLIERAWEMACRRWSIYGFSRPRICRSILDGERAQSPELAWINFAEKRITVNLHRLDVLGLLDYLDSFFTHELGHKFCPGDLKTKLLVDFAVRQVFKDDYSAHTVGNLYRDMLVNVDAHRRGDRGMQQIYARFWKDSPDPVSQIIGRAYEKLFQQQDTSQSYQQTIIRAKPEAAIEAAADRVVAIILQSRRSNWLRSAREFAEVISQFVPTIPAGVTYVFSEQKGSDFSPEGRHPIPPKGRSSVRDLEKRLGGVIYELRQLEGENDKKPCSIGTFKQFLEASEIKVVDTEALIWYYRDLIGGKVVKVPEVSAASGSLYPFAPRTWQPGDPPHQLDVVLSKSIGGVLIPGYTTKKWEFRRGQHLTVGRDYPDLDLWIDCSGSVDDPAETVSHIVASGMIVSKSFLATRKAVRVIAFSGTPERDPLFTSTGGFIHDEDEIDRKILTYLGDQTILPLDEIEAPYQVEGKQKYIVLITDLGIQNITEETKQRLRRVFERSVGGTVFLVGKGKEAVQRIFEEIGFEVVPVKEVADLDQHALKLTKKLFEERIAV